MRSDALFGMEANFLRRLEAGRSVASASQSIKLSIGTRRVPEWMKKIAARYLRWFLNSMDYIVVSDWALYEELLEEGINHPQIRVIPERYSLLIKHQEWRKS